MVGSLAAALVLITACIPSSHTFSPMQHQRTSRPSTSTQTIRSCKRRVPVGLNEEASRDQDTGTSFNRPILSTNPKQIRRKPKTRRPREYWSSRDNIQKEFMQFWHDAGVKFSTSLPPIPNEALLNHFERNDIRWAIARHGGRQAVSEWLGGAPLVPGKWSEAVATSPEVQQLLDPSNAAGKGLRPDAPPKSPQSKRMAPSDSSESEERWQHKPGRKPKGYWNEERVMVELLKYLYECRDELNRPAVWMPRPSELSAVGRQDLKTAMARFGGHRHICKQLQLVPYNEWNYFEMQFQLILELQEYLEKKYGDFDAEYCFPYMTDVLGDDEYQTLYDLVQYFGGRKFVASRLGLELCGASNKRDRETTYRSTDLAQISFGKFNLDFAVRLLSFIREDMMQRRPPLKPAEIQMPRKELLLARGETRLAEEIEKYGGYENVARRLGLAIF